MYNIFIRDTESEFIKANRKLIKYCKNRLSILPKNETSKKASELDALLKMAKRNAVNIVSVRQKKQQSIMRLLKEVNAFNQKNKMF